MTLDNRMSKVALAAAMALMLAACGGSQEAANTRQATVQVMHDMAAHSYYSRMLQGVRATAQTGSPIVVVPSPFPGLFTTTHTYILVQTSTTERAYNAYHNRMGVALPQTENHILDDVRPRAPPTNLHNIVFETLTNGGMRRGSEDIFSFPREIFLPKSPMEIFCSSGYPVWAAALSEDKMMIAEGV